MVSERIASRLTVAIAIAAIVASVVLGTHLRLRDPASSHILTAEDPFTHMANVREHLRDGSIDPLNPGGELYPPGMHATIASIQVFTGVPLYEIMRFGAVFFGAVGILGIALLLWKGEGPIAAVVGAFAMAIAPEVIFRTTMTAPTALDIALVPFFLFALLELMQGKLPWIGVAAPLAFFLVYSHPWLFTILTLTGLMFLVFALLMPWPLTRGQKLNAEGLVAAFAIVGVCWGLSFNGCFGGCGPGFRDVVPDHQMIEPLAPLIIGLALLPAALITFAPRGFNWIVPHNSERLRPIFVRVALTLVFATAFYMMTKPAYDQGLPPHVNLHIMFGEPIMLLAAIGFILLPFAASPASHMGAAIGLSTYPFVIYNPLDSPFWSHRTAIYLGFGLIILSGVAARTIAYGLTRLFFATRNWIAQRRFRPVRAPRPLLAALVALLVTTALTGCVYATKQQPRNNWYRLFNDCEFAELTEMSQRGENETDAIIVTGSWQSKLVLAALTPDAQRVWFKDDFFTDTEAANRLPFEMRRPFFVVVDPYLQRVKDADTEFLSHAPWREIDRDCLNPKTGNETIVVYTV